jgi:hypothetical protein
MNSQQNHKDHMKIGRYQSWLEDGHLKMYYHEFGNPSGTYCNLNAEETKGLLELLSRNTDGINEAIYLHEKDEHTQQHASRFQ